MPALQKSKTPAGRRYENRCACAKLSIDGVGVLFARSGTACCAPTDNCALLMQGTAILNL
jgi:hypothetical protein